MKNNDYLIYQFHDQFQAEKDGMYTHILGTKACRSADRRWKLSNGPIEPGSISITGPGRTAAKCMIPSRRKDG